jgi:hypothetical protein
MKGFMLAGLQRQPMRRLLEWCDEAAPVQGEQETGQEPGWQQAHRRLPAEGRRAKVNHPSAAHENVQIRLPG